MSHLRGERGFTLIELLVASGICVVVLGSAVAITSQVQNGYRRQMEQSAAEQEGRYALDWIGKYVRGAGNNPYPADLALAQDCPTAGTAFEPIQLDPDGDTIDNDIRLQADSNPPDGTLGGTSGDCSQANEDVTISFDAANHTIVFLDNNLGGGQSTRTDKVIEDLRFIYRDSQYRTEDPPGTPITAANVVYVETQITTRTRTVDPSTGLPVTHVLSSEVRVRNR